MRCPDCHQTEEPGADSRVSRSGSAVRRRRAGLSCGGPCSTEACAAQSPIEWRKRDGCGGPFERRRLPRSLRMPCAERRITPAAIGPMVGEIEDELIRLATDEVPSRTIGELV